MNYQKIYTAFIADRRTTEDINVLLSRVERHHILPRSLGGADTPDNLIFLTPEDHFFAHLLLAKIHGGKMAQALMIMSRRAKGRDRSEAFARRTRKAYAFARRAASGVYLEDFRRRQADGCGPMDSPEARAKVSAALKGRKKSPESIAKMAATKTGTRRSAESRARQSATMTGMKRPPEFGAAVSAALKGLKKSPEHIEKMRANFTGRVASAETREKLKAASARRTNKTPNAGNTHSGATKARMAAVYAAKREYSRRYGTSPKIITLAMIAAAGIEVSVCL